MKFDKKHRIQSAAAVDPTRYAISEVLFEKDKEGARLVATDGRILAVVPVVEAEGDVPGYIERQTLIEATKGRTRSKPDAALLLPEEGKVLFATKAGMVEAKRPDAEHLRFPDYRGVIPKSYPAGLQITLSASHLRNLIDALGANHDDLDGITLRFQADEKDSSKIDQHSPVRVEPCSSLNEAFGVIMPIKGK